MNYQVVFWKNEDNRILGISDVAAPDMNISSAKLLSQALVGEGYAIAAEVRTIEDEPVAVYVCDCE